MYWKLKKDIWWGDRHSVSELKDQVGSVINLCHNPELTPGNTRYDALVLPGTTPYFRFGRHDNHFLTIPELRTLTIIIELALSYKPVLIHCYLGQHRSVNVAIAAALIDEGACTAADLDMYTTVAKQLRKDIVTELQYSISLRRWIASGAGN